VERTQVYFPPAQLRALKHEAKRAGLSVTELVRRLVADHLADRRGVAKFRKQEVLSFVALGRGRARKAAVSERHDEALDEAFRARSIR
jgi:hypothetical protein